MSTEIKNTLFRFATMRTPNLLEEETLKALFTKHPESELSLSSTFDSAFLQAAYHAAENSSLKIVLEAQVTSFKNNAIKAKEDLYKKNIISKHFYEFAIWLNKNRKNIKYDQLVSEIGINEELNRLAKLEKISSKPTLIQLWDNLFYQILTSESNYVKDMLLSVLSAQFFLENYQALGQNESELQKIAQCRIIVPTILISKEKETFIAQTQEKTLNDSLNKEMNVMLSKEKIEQLEASLAYVQKQKIIYDKAEQAAFNLAQKTYDEQIRTLYSSAETSQKTIFDPAINQERTITEYQNLVIPPFEYEKTAVNDFMSENTATMRGIAYNELIASDLLNNDDYESFDELINVIQEAITVENNAIIQNSQQSETLVNSNGIVLPALTATTSAQTFSLGSNGNGLTATYPLTLLFSSNFNQQKIASVDYTVVFNDNTSQNGETFESSITNNKLALKIFPSGLNTTGKKTLTITGEILFSNGEKAIFSGTATIKTPTIISILSGYSATGQGVYELESQTNTIDYIPTGFGFKRIGVLDYRKVEQEVCCYVPGEVSHIENIMAREYKERSTRSLRRSENTTTTTSEKESEKLTDTSSTNRFEMNQEVDSVVAKDQHFGAFVNLNTNYPKINVSAGADFATNTSSEESNHQAITHAKEVTEKVLDRVVQKVKEERISKIIEEFEENNKHGYDNREGNTHISGVFRWVDKIYKNKVINYGKRMMYEFMIPHPAAFHLKATEAKKDAFGFEMIDKPIDPRKANENLVLKLADKFEERYKYWVEKYNAEIEEKPLDTIWVGKSFSILGHPQGAKLDHTESNSGQGEVIIPENYIAINTESVFNASSDGDTQGNLLSLSVGSAKKITSAKFNSISFPLIDKLNPTIDKVPVSYTLGNHVSGDITVNIECILSDKGRQQWRIDTFNKIIKAYETKLKEYNDKLADIKTIQGNKLKTNPLFYREIENTVLRKNCMEYLSSHDIVGGASLIDYGQEPTLAKNLKVRYNNPELETYAARVKFLEQAFEWNLMSYNLYPFYWAEKDKWVDLYNINDIDDATHKAFLQSGMARVVVTVRPGFEEAVNWYMATGQVWNGGQVPTVDDPLFLSIVDELRVTTGEIEETWETRVPTSLTIIQAGEIGLEVDKALPCCEERGDNPFGFREQKTNLIEFSFYEDTGYVMQTIGELDSAGLFPRVYKCMGKTITIHRDAAWFSGTRVAVIYEKLADQISLIPGVQAFPAVTSDGRIFGIRFRIDSNIIKDFSFAKPGIDSEGLDGLIITVQGENLMVKRRDDMHYAETIFDKNKVAITQSEVNVLLPLSRFLV